jgi:hypothetical protein
MTIDMPKYAENLLSRTYLQPERPKHIYVCSPYGGKEENYYAAVEYARKVWDAGHIPMAPHLEWHTVIDEGTEREQALAACAERIKLCDEMWVFGDHVSKGMARDIQVALDADMHVDISGFSGGAAAPDSSKRLCGNCRWCSTSAAHKYTGFCVFRTTSSDGKDHAGWVELDAKGCDRWEDAPWLEYTPSESSYIVTCETCRYSEQQEGIHWNRCRLITDEWGTGKEAIPCNMLGYCGLHEPRDDGE